MSALPITFTTALSPMGAMASPRAAGPSLTETLRQAFILAAVFALGYAPKLAKAIGMLML